MLWLYCSGAGAATARQALFPKKSQADHCYGQVKDNFGLVAVVVCLTFHVDEIAKESQRLHLEEVCDVLQRDLEGIAFVQL